MTLSPSPEAAERSLDQLDADDARRRHKHLPPLRELVPDAHRSNSRRAQIPDQGTTTIPAGTRIDPAVWRRPTQTDVATQRSTTSLPITYGGSTTLLAPFIEVDADAELAMLSHCESPPSLSTVLQSHGISEWHQRAQEMLKRYSMGLDRNGWDPSHKPQVERINKASRMRVRWTCHECRKSFGHDRICADCAHERCQKCMRYPPRRKKSRLLREPGASTTEPAAAEVHSGACHECQTIFDIGATECETCHHVICERCLEETVARAHEQRSIPNIRAPTAVEHASVA